MNTRLVVDFLYKPTSPPYYSFFSKFKIQQKRNFSPALYFADPIFNNKIQTPQSTSLTHNDKHITKPHSNTNPLPFGIIINFSSDNKPNRRPSQAKIKLQPWQQHSTSSIGINNSTLTPISSSIDSGNLNFSFNSCKPIQLHARSSSNSELHKEKSTAEPSYLENNSAPASISSSSSKKDREFRLTYKREVRSRLLLISRNFGILHYRGNSARSCFFFFLQTQET